MIDTLLRAGSSLSNRGNSSNLLRNIGINGAIFLAVFVAFFIVARATGIVSVVGYEWKSESASGLFSTKSFPISFMTPVYLHEGEQLVGQYDAEIEAGKIRVYLKRNMSPLMLMSKRFSSAQYINESGQGEIILTATKDGFYTPISSSTAGNYSPECKASYRKKSFAKRMLMPDSECPTYKLSYSILWSIAQ